MTRIRLGLLQIIILLQVFVSGCAYINAQRDDVDSLITKWLSEQEFDKASDTLTQVKITHPQYLKLMLRKKEIFEKTNTFVAVSIKQAHFFIKENKWKDAYTVYNFALSRVAENKSLNFSYKTYLQNRNVYISSLKYKLLITEATGLIKNIPIQQKIALAIQETSVEQKKLDRLQNQAINATEHLVQCATDSVKQKKTVRARNCIQLGLKLQPSEELLLVLKQQQKKLAKLTLVKKNKKKTADTNNQTRLLNEYKAAFIKNDLYTANKILSKLSSKNKNNYEYKKLKSTLDEAINKKLKTGIETGRILYSRGNIKLALDKWQRLQKLAPENVELKSHISRAERVLHKLRSLTNKEENTWQNGG